MAIRITAKALRSQERYFITVLLIKNRNIFPAMIYYIVVLPVKPVLLVELEVPVLLVVEVEPVVL
jgi:hypothetical protein